MATVLTRGRRGRLALQSPYSLQQVFSCRSHTEVCFFTTVKPHYLKVQLWNGGAWRPACTSALYCCFLMQPEWDFQMRLLSSQAEGRAGSSAVPNAGLSTDIVCLVGGGGKWKRVFPFQKSRNQLHPLRIIFIPLLERDKIFISLQYHSKLA